MGDLRKNQFLFYCKRDYQYYQIFKLDLNKDFSAVPVAVPATARPKFSLSHQHPKRRRMRGWNWASSMTGRCNRHLRMRYTARQLSWMDRQGRPFPKPFFEIHCTARKGGFPEEFAMAASGSKLYLFGGYSWKGATSSGSGMVLPRDVHYIDATADFGVMVKMSCLMNSGKRSPLAWTVAGKIYVLPSTFVFREDPGHFECFDPKSGSWTILPSPPFVDDKSQFTIPSEGRPLLLVKNNVLLGSNLVISTHERKHYSFDTAQPGRGWRPVVLKFRSEELRFLPFDPLTSVPVGDGLIYSYVDSRSFPRPDFLCVDTYCHSAWYAYEGPHIDRGGPAEKIFLKRSLNIGDGDSYVTRFEYDAHDEGEDLPLKLDLSIKPVRGIGGMVQWGMHVKYNNPEAEVVGIGDGLVMFVKTGVDRLYTEKRSSLNLFRIREENKASIISTALFVPGVNSDEARRHFCSFVMKDGIFT